MTALRNLFTLDENASSFEKVVWDAFTYQMEHNELYRSFVNTLGNKVDDIRQIPFLPISFFKTQAVRTKEVAPEKIFLSSATSGSTRSQHYIQDISLYEESFKTGFEHRFGSIQDWTILALLPSYLAQGDSSLIYMVDKLMGDASEESSYWLKEPTGLAEKITELLARGAKVMLFGVSYALLDLSEKGPFNFKELHVTETGGMKGRKKEMIRKELHEKLRLGFGTNRIHSEYGMTELLSQAYSLNSSHFSCPPWMKVKIRETDDPLSTAKLGSVGGINVIDLANWHSCPFIATDDLGRLHEDGTFEVLGRFDHSDVRGCNLLVV